MAIPPAGLMVTTQGLEEGFMVKPEHWDFLVGLLNENGRGWVELEHVFGGAKVLLRVQDITDLFLVTPEYVEERRAWDLSGALGQE